MTGMDRIKLLLILGFLLSACQTTEQLHEPEDKLINYTYRNIQFSPENINKELFDGLLLRVTPIDASTLNLMTFLSASRAGDYERELVDEYLDLDLDNLSRRDRDRTENKINVSNKILNSISDGTISAELGRTLIDNIWGEEGLDGSETELFTGTRATPLFNPYQIGSNYLSVFELEFQNTTDHVRNIRFESFQVSSGYEILAPFDIEYFEQRLREHPLKVENAYRYNLSHELNIPPAQRVIKYLAVPAIDVNLENVSVQFIDEGYNSFDFRIAIIREEEEISLKNYFVDVDYPDLNLRDQGFTNSYLAIQFVNEQTFPLKGNEFFIPDDISDSTIDLCIATISRSLGELDCREINLSEHANRNIKIEIETDS